jgi:hypothetical protein
MTKQRKPREWPMDRKPDFEKWLSMPMWEIWQGVALSLNIDPDKVRRHPDGSFDESPEFMGRLEDAMNARLRGEL